jgi:hypothetical protein
LSRFSTLNQIISTHRKPVALLGAVLLAVLVSAGVSLAHHSSFSLLPNTHPFMAPTTSRIVTVDESIPFELQQDEDASMSSGSQSVRSQGQMGLRQESFRVTYLNGQEIRRTLLSEKVLKAAVPRVIVSGTGVDLSAENSSSQANVSQNNSDVTVNSTGTCNVKTSGDIGNRNVTSSNGSYHFSNSSNSGSSNNSISVNCTSN